MLFWEATARCNLSCVHCRRVETAAENELSTEEAKAVFTSAAEVGPPVVVFSGGEPLLREDWEPLAAAAADVGVPTALATNGTLIDEALAGRIAAAGFRRVAVSIDGADPDTHDALRGRPGAFARAVAGIESLRRAGAAVQINATVSRRNVAELGRIQALARSLGAEALHLFVLVPVGCGMQLARTEQLGPAEYAGVLRWAADRRDDGLELRLTCAPQQVRVAMERGEPAGARGCLCGVSVAFVAQTGTVFPCGYLPVDCGSVRERPLVDIWRDSEVFTALRDRSRLKGACAACTDTAACAGCRARAYAATGDYLAADPTCPFGPRAQ
jgi:radical SAM protein with 4Fe4S-binding SPASM domain